MTSTTNLQTSRQLEVHKYRLLLLASLILLISYPYFNQGRFAEFFFDVMTSLILLTALLSTSHTSRHRIIGLTLFSLAIIGTWWPSGAAASPTHLAGHIFAIGFFALVTHSLYSDVFSTRNVGSESVFGAVCIYLMLGLNWSMVYVLLEGIAPGSFNLVNAGNLSYGELTARFIYFSFTTLTTTGYGDITPVTDIARSIVMLEYIVGVLYIAIMMARLVSAYQPMNFADSEED